MKLSQTLFGIDFPNPVIVSGGKWAWTAEDWRAAAKAGAGAVTTKSFWAHEHTGNPEPVVASGDEWTLNAVGLPDFGPEHSGGEMKDYLADPPVPLIVNIVGMTADEYAENARRLRELKPAAVEVNLSSPTFLKLRGTFFDVEEAIRIVPAVKKEAGDIPVVVKLSPNVPDIGGFAARCVDAGADGIVAINTLGTGLAIDPVTRLPILSAVRGGVSGPGIKPLALRCVADIYAATEGTVPIIGVGGMMRGQDVAEMLLAGASLVGLATAIHREGMPALTRVRGEFERWCEEHQIGDVRELVGGMHRAMADQGKPYTR
jgi:dihydroorotate dehydrogenase (NAD+) catalytic subunit